jgi:hypothetical protein
MFYSCIVTSPTYLLARFQENPPGLRNVKTLNFIQILHFSALKVAFHEKPSFRNVLKLHFHDKTPTSPGRDGSGQAETGTPLSEI